jgi:hypothetical protein
MQNSDTSSTIAQTQEQRADLETDRIRGVYLWATWVDTAIHDRYE